MSEAEDIQRIIDEKSVKHCSVRLTSKAQSVLDGDMIKTEGDTMSMPEPRARALCEAGFAEPVDPAGAVGWFKKLAALIRSEPEATSPRLDDPAPGRPYKVEVLPDKDRDELAWDEKTETWKTVKTSPGRGVFSVDRSYGTGTILWLKEDIARLHVKAGNVRLLDPPALPPEPEPAGPFYPVSRFGCSPMVGRPETRPGF